MGWKPRVQILVEKVIHFLTMKSSLVVGPAPSNSGVWSWLLTCIWCQCLKCVQHYHNDPIHLCDMVALGQLYFRIIGIIPYMCLSLSILPLINFELVHEIFMGGMPLENPCLHTSDLLTSCGKLIVIQVVNKCPCLLWNQNVHHHVHKSPRLNAAQPVQSNAQASMIQTLWLQASGVAATLAPLNLGSWNLLW
jgi:hypothetical protein